MQMLRSSLLPTILLALVAAANAKGQSLPTDFTAEEIGLGWEFPTCICFADDASNVDLLVAEKKGMVFNVRNGVRRTTPVIDVRDEVLDNGDRGLLSVAADPEWSQNGYIYLLYIVDPDGDGYDDEQESFGRLTRYTTTLDLNGDVVADPASRLVLIGPDWPNGIPSLHWSHSTGDLRFGVDGSLFISTGDGAHYDLTDAGGHDPNGFGPGKFDASEDIGAFRSQSITSLAGKILRIDPATGLGLPDNPMYNGTPADHQSMIWAMGLRNPFRFTVRPNTGSPGKLYICDVGWSTWEELDETVAGAENFGWPCFEGTKVQGSYDALDPLGMCDDPTIFDLPLWWFHHSFAGKAGFPAACVSGAQVYTGNLYPQKYNGRLFFCEYSYDWIRTVRFVNGQATDVELFANNIGNPVDLIADPVNGDLLFISYTENRIRRIRYTNVDLPPVAVGTAKPRFGPSPLAVAFDATGSTDPEAQPLAYLWEFGDGTTDTNALATHTYPLGLDYTAKLTVTDVAGSTSTWTAYISVDNTPPVIQSINTPANQSFFTAGQLLTFDATAVDTEDNNAGIPLIAEWIIDLIHDHHSHPGWAKLTGLTAQWTADSHGPGTYFHVTLKVTDSRKTKDVASIDIYDLDGKPEPHVVNVSDYSPRLGTEVETTAHLHYPGKGTADLVVDWGDGASAAFTPVHLQDCVAKHAYSAPGLYTLRVTADDGVAKATESATILVRPLHPGVAIFAPLSNERWMTADEQWAVATQLAGEIQASGFEAEIFGYADQTALQEWMNAYLDDGIRDYLVCLDTVPSVAYAGEDDTSLAEAWLDKGNGILVTGYVPFWRYVLPDGTDDDTGSGQFAADEVLDAAIAQLCTGGASMVLGPDAGDVPALQPFTASHALVTSRLNSTWSIDRLYATDGLAPPTSDALVIRDTNGGEYAQFFCRADPTLPRADVFRDFFLTHLFAGLPAGPGPFTLRSPMDHAVDVPYASTTLTWQPTTGPTSWLLEVAEDPEFTLPVHTSVVTSAKATLTRVLRPGQTYYWRVTARNDYGYWTTGPFVFQTLSQAKKPPGSFPPAKSK